ncbi:hypothetical protein BFJ72_g13471 [Fusarium proliferatum]|uniref:Uncharacterized protein n=1 Tax=Gibberella intermedia TaxID=948311 RepID=A0A420SCE5_GIBIN|nr:hypothetical protein BFJ72_g13471 [Fusarium proliferatum]
MKTGVILCSDTYVMVNYVSYNIWVSDKDMGTTAIGSMFSVMSTYKYFTLLAIEDKDVTAWLDKHIITLLAKLHTIRDNMNVSTTRERYEEARDHDRQPGHRRPRKGPA